ncbi:MAG: hypothetical protein E6Q73_14080 [Pseudorhodobacter sp.]|nr:MAG: hypothetical protein E6Q73_14080 [Pseudorhodobacter sp.]
MAKIARDPILGHEVNLDPGEKLIAVFRPDAGVYWRTNRIMAVIAGVLAGAALVYGGNPTPWVGPVAAVLAIGLRAAYLKSEALGEEWELTSRRLIGPGGRVASLSGLKEVRSFFGAVQLVSASDKYLMKYHADPAATIAAIDKARGVRR